MHDTIIIRYAEIALKGGNRKDSFLLGDRLRIHVSLESKYEQAKLRIIIGFYDHLNAGVLRFDTNLAGYPMVMNGSKGMATCETDDISITPGTYYANIAIFRDDQMEDYITQAFSLTIVPSDFFGTGKTLETQDGVMLLEQNWEVLNNYE